MSKKELQNWVQEALQELEKTLYIDWSGKRKKLIAEGHRLQEGAGDK
jgi:hypothetical protein